jgi:hypothetical protein
MSIQDLRDKIKGFGAVSLNMLPISIIILLVAIGSFFLGRISAKNEGGARNVSIVESATGLPINTSSYLSNSQYQNKSSYKSTLGNSSGAKGMYVASKNGKLYYTADCKGAERLSEKNKIWFNTEEEAVNAGYEEALSCNK